MTGLMFGFLLSPILGCSTKSISRSNSSNRDSDSRAPASSSSESTDNASSANSIPEIPKSNVAYFQWPVDQARMSRGFNPKLRKPHWGIDLAAPKGTPILAAHDGVVIYTGREFRGFGKMVMIEGGKGWATLYAHFSKITAREGQRVRRGDVIGEMGRTGHATGNHLHFELRSEQGPVDPLDYLPNGSAVAKLTSKQSRPN